MKPGTVAIGALVAGVLGYVLEPSLRPALLSTSQQSEGEGEEIVVKGGDGKESGTTPDSPETVTPPTAPTKAVPAWVGTLMPEQLPKQVKLLEAASIPIPGAAQPIVLPTGSMLVPTAVAGTDLVISSPVQGTVPVMSTDLVTALGGKPPEAAPEAPAVAENPEMAGEPTAPPAEPVPAAPEEPSEPEPADVSLSEEEIVAVMQESVKGGEIKEFTFDQVLEWSATDDKESGGVTYQSGMAVYKAETIFGVKEIQAQALIKGKKVEKWIWPKSGMQIN